MDEVIAVLGGANDESGALLSLGAERVAVALDALVARPDALVVVTGGFGAFNPTDVPHHEHVRRVLLEAGVAPGRILPGLDSSHTAGDAAALATLDPAPLELVVATHEWHRPRAGVHLWQVLGRPVTWALVPNRPDDHEMEAFYAHETGRLGELVTAAGTSARFVLQMDGWPGSGKTTLARAVAAATGAVRIDLDVTKSAIEEAGVVHPLSGRLGHLTLHAVVAELACSGHDVVLDTTCSYPQSLNRGLATAAMAGAAYAWVTVTCPTERRADRIATRTRAGSQMRPGAVLPAVDNGFARRVQTPPTPTLTVDGTAPVEDSLAAVLAYLGR